MSSQTCSSSESPIPVACAVIEDGMGRILIAQRSKSMSHPGKWEFPGGKVESGEEPTAALVREIDEELGCIVIVVSPLTPTSHDYGMGSIRLIPYRCRILSGTPAAREHSQLAWILASDLAGFEWATADLPIVAEITENAAFM